MVASLNSIEHHFEVSLEGDVVSEIDNGRILPDEILLKIFGYLGQIDLARSKCVCRVWRSIANDKSILSLKGLIQKHYPGLPVSVIDEHDWKRYVDLKKFGLSVDDAPVLDFDKTIGNLIDFSNLPIEGGLGGTLMLIPSGISFDKVLEIAAEMPKQGHQFKFDYVNEKIKISYGQIVNNESYWVWLANNIIESSRDKSVEQQSKILKKIHCEFPDLVELTALTVLKFMISKGLERLFDWDGKPIQHDNVFRERGLRYSRCKSKVGNDYEVVIGANSPIGLSVLCNSFNYIIFGVSPARNFTPVCQ